MAGDYLLSSREMEQSKFRSAIELTNHDSSPAVESNAFDRSEAVAAAATPPDNGPSGSSLNVKRPTTAGMNSPPLSSSASSSSRDSSINQEPISCRLSGGKRRGQYVKCQREQQQQDNNVSMKFRGRNKKSKPKEAKKRSHFRIDWQQLSYYQRPHSFLSKCLASLDVFSPSNSKAVDQKLQLDERSEVSSLMTNVVISSASTDLRKDTGKPKQILNSLDGCFKSGELSAILGPSGAGKSTFLSTLFGSKQDGAFGYTKVTWLNDQPTTTTATTTGGDNLSSPTSLVTTVTGENRIELPPPPPTTTTTNDDERHRSLRIAFLPQHDHLLHHLTVYETLMFASKIKNHERFEREISKASPSESNGTDRTNFHHMNVKRVAKMLKLTECLNTRCGKLSGGQYKRVSIGQELLSEPDVIILDEPTSGLDAMTCLTTVQTLKSIVTKHSMSIILTIHQPDNDVFSLFDKVYVIAQGGMAIYEGPPDGIFATLAEVNLIPPRPNYNPARFIVENAFVPEPGAQDHLIGLTAAAAAAAAASAGTEDEDTTVVSSSDDDDDDDGERNSSSSSSEEDCRAVKQKENYFKRSVQSLSGTILGKETPFVRGSPFNTKRDTIRRPLLNIGGVRTLDGQLITSEQLASMKQRDTFIRQQQGRIELLKRLNRMQRAKYLESTSTSTSNTTSEDILAPGKKQQSQEQQSSSSGRNSPSVSSPSPNSSSDGSTESRKQISSSSSSSSGSGRDSKSTSAKSDYSSASACSMMMVAQKSMADEKATTYASSGKSISLASLHVDDTSNSKSPPISLGDHARSAGRQKQLNSLADGLLHIDTTSVTKQPPPATTTRKANEFVVELGPDTTTTIEEEEPRKLRRKFDKRLSAKHNCSKQTGYPILYHALLLTHRTWLSIVRDPIFFGIQACMHTLIPIVLAAIFGSVQEEGCPRIGNFDLVDFAYSDSENLIQGTVRSIRQSIGNIGIVFFEMFVICFAINCITALVFPLDMYVLLKEYRNGWYSLRSYFMGRTLADLPVPVVLHSIGMAILYFMTGQPHSLWRFSSIVLLVILASLVAQSVGLTIGALLMKSSQSAVLAAAGIVAPFFALSGFIVRIHTLPAIAQLAANASYLYHLLNGFIILRYGFGRCQCSQEDFEQNSAHQIPSNLHTMASMWIGTYSEEYANSTSVLAAAHQLGHSPNRSNVDPNIDVVDKMMTAFKMANSYGHQIDDCQDVLPYAMLDFNQRDQDIYYCFYALIVMLLITRLVTFSAIYYKIRSFA